jgi:hypothetical protein
MMRRWLIAAISTALLATTVVFGDSKPGVSPLYGVSLPEGYQQWALIAPSLEAEPLDELRVIVGNDIALKAYRGGALPFPDGSILVKLAWKRVPSPEFAPASIAGAATTVQVMVKDSGQYARSGGWGFGRFNNGVPADEAQHQTCFACHQARVQAHDFVFTRLAPRGLPPQPLNLLK